MRKYNKALTKDPICIKIKKAKAADQNAIIVVKCKVVSSVVYKSALLLR